MKIITNDAFVDLSFVLQPEAPAASSRHGTPRHDEEDDGDLNKTLGVQRFQPILSPAAAVPDEQHHSYHEEDIECKRSPCCSQNSLSRRVYQLASFGTFVRWTLFLVRRPPSLLSPHPPASVQTALRGTQEEEQQEKEEGQRSQEQPCSQQRPHRGGRGWGGGGRRGGDRDHFCFSSSWVGESQGCGGNHSTSHYSKHTDMDGLLWLFVSSSLLKTLKLFK